MKENRKLACKEELTASEERYRRLFETAKDGILILDAETGKIIDVNPFLTDLLGFCKENFIDKELWEIGSFKDIAANEEKFAELQQKGYVRYDNLPLETTDGRKINVEFVSNVYLANNKKVIQCNIRDITERKNSKKKIIESEKRFKAIFDQAPLGMALLDMQGQLCIVNSPLSKMVGYSCEELTKMKFTDFTFSEDIEKDMSQFTDLIEGKISSYSMEKRYVHENGSLVWVNLFVSILCDENGISQEVLGMAKDITERKKTEVEIRDLAKFPSESPNPIMRISRNGILLYVNEAAMKQLPDWKLQTDKLAPTILQNIVFNTMKLGEVQVAEIKHRKKIYSFYVAPLITDCYANLYGWDITESKQAEEKLINSEERFKILFDYAPDAYYLNDLKGTFIDGNIAAESLLGYEKNMIIGKNFLSLNLLPFDQVVKATKLLAKNLLGKATGPDEFVLNRKDGSKVTVEISTHPVKIKDKSIVLGIARDITERKQAEEEIAILSQSLKSINECVSITDLNNNILFVNESFLKTYGYGTKELIGKNITIIRSRNNEHEIVEEILPATIIGEWQGELLNRRKDGSEFPIYLSTSVIRDKESKVLGLIGVATDITERKQVEKELIKAKEKAEESDRLKSFFLANMSHEVRTPLNSIIGFSELLVDSFFDEDQKNEFIQHIITNGNSLLTIISDIMDISKLESGECNIHKTQINAQQFISKVKEQFSFQAKEKKLELVLTIPDYNQETIILADADRLKQIFNNLISNAIKFTANGSIEIGYQLKGKMVEFFVKDTGIGIPAEYQDKIFERFMQVETSYTRQFGGVGLGLPISKNLVELMGGKIWFESYSENQSESKGSKFYFTVPIYS